MKQKDIEKAYALAKEQYAAIGINTDTAIRKPHFHALLAGR